MQKILLFILIFGVSSAYAQPNELKDPAAFNSIDNRSERSRALFVEAGKVITSPRCLNCHPKDNHPTQGADMHQHLPLVSRGVDDKGTSPLRCTSCHQAQNFKASGVPGHPLWHLAPLSMAWQGKTLGQICTQIKDPKRNGGKSLAAIQEHMTHDTLVGWAWDPGGEREPAPGTQARFGALIAAWIESGAACPAST